MGIGFKFISGSHPIKDTCKVYSCILCCFGIYCIISTKYRFRILSFLDEYLPENFLDIVVGGEDVQTAKPSPEGVNFALEHLGSAPQETLYIGDSTIDAETAQKYFFYLFQTNFSFIFCCFLLKHFTYTLFSFWRYSFHEFLKYLLSSSTSIIIFVASR